MLELVKVKNTGIFLSFFSFSFLLVLLVYMSPCVRIIKFFYTLLAVESTTVVLFSTTVVCFALAFSTSVFSTAVSVVFAVVVGFVSVHDFK